MKDTLPLTQLELVLLQLIEKGKGQWSWYELANALSRRDVPREPDMMTVLKDLVKQELVKRHVENGSPRDRWELTLKGEFLLTNLAQNAIAYHLTPSDLSSQETTGESILKIVDKLTEDFTEEELSQLPCDGAEQHDHYLYGSPKRKS